MPNVQCPQTLETAFHYCALAGNNDVLAEMISHMSPSEVQKALNAQTAVGWTPLLIACHKGHMELVRVSSRALLPAPDRPTARLVSGTG